MRKTIHLSVVLSILLIAIPVSGQRPPTPHEDGIATGELAGTFLTVSPSISFESATLRVAGPDRYEAVAWSRGEPIILDLIADGSISSSDGEEGVSSLAALPDGRYGYEVVFYLSDGERRSHDGFFFVQDGAVTERPPREPRYEPFLPGSSILEEGGDGLANVTAESGSTGEAFVIVDTDNDGEANLQILSNDSSGHLINYWGVRNESGDLRLSTSDGGNWVDFFTFEPGGELGIGTTTPQADLHIFRPGGSIRITDSDSCAGPNPNASWEIEEDFGRLKFEVAPNCPDDLVGGKMWIHGTGDVGIGTKDPLASLHINRPFSAIRLTDSDPCPGSVPSWQISQGFGILQFGVVAKCDDDPVGTKMAIDELGNVGIGTTNPGEELEIRRAFPSLRFRDVDGTPQIWDIEGNSFDFQVQDVTNGGVAPFLIEPGAPHRTLHLDSTGRIGIGTAAPAARLHVIGGGIIEGDVAFGSSRTFKHEIAPLDVSEVLRSIRDLPLYAWKYRDDPLQAAHVGPMAEDVHAAFRLGRDEKHLSPADSAGLALAAIQGVDGELAELRSVVDHLASRNGELASENRSLRDRLQALEEQMGRLSARHDEGTD